MGEPGGINPKRDEQARMVSQVLLAILVPGWLVFMPVTLWARVRSTHWLLFPVGFVAVVCCVAVIGYGENRAEPRTRRLTQGIGLFMLLLWGFATCANIPMG